MTGAIVAVHDGVDSLEDTICFLGGDPRTALQACDMVISSLDATTLQSPAVASESPGSPLSEETIVPSGCSSPESIVSVPSSVKSDGCYTRAPLDVQETDCDRSCSTTRETTDYSHHDVALTATTPQPEEFRSSVAQDDVVNGNICCTLNTPVVKQEWKKLSLSPLAWHCDGSDIGRTFCVITTQVPPNIGCRIIGLKGRRVKEIQQLTGVTVNVSRAKDICSSNTTRRLQIAGAMSGVYVAYAICISLYAMPYERSGLPVASKETSNERATRLGRPQQRDFITRLTASLHG
eukprot:GHVQ01004474.1.p1 GENE.GHVQ01004474.1~~GHVQ01004474.1.p1  ORF type:complete len:326 (-),score=39.00 GHVQ01004474.1:761-1636(-)